MKLKFLSLIGLIALNAVLTAQPLTATVTDCNGVSKSIQTTLSTGKAILIAHKGVDCSICQSQAPALQSWAAQNKTKVEVWGAMTWKYNPSTFNPECTATSNWVNQYNWSDIYTFPDYNRDWLSSGTPRYYVYSPIDSTIVWQGSSQSTAQSVALQNSIVGLQDDYFKDHSMLIVSNNGRLTLDNIPTSAKQLKLIDLNGRLISNIEVSESNVQINGLKRTIVILQVLDSNEGLIRKKIKIN